jgi:hypothetical protein
LKRYIKFRVLIVVQIVATILLQFQDLSSEDFFLNPFYIIGMINGIYIMFMGLRYWCKACQKHQIYSEILRLPKEKCWSCGNDTDYS